MLRQNSAYDVKVGLHLRMLRQNSAYDVKAGLHLRMSIHFHVHTETNRHTDTRTQTHIHTDTDTHTDTYACTNKRRRQVQIRKSKEDCKCRGKHFLERTWAVLLTGSHARCIASQSTKPFPAEDESMSAAWAAESCPGGASRICLQDERAPIPPGCGSS